MIDDDEYFLILSAAVFGGRITDAMMIKLGDSRRQLRGLKARGYLESTGNGYRLTDFGWNIVQAHYAHFPLDPDRPNPLPPILHAILPLG